MPKVIIMRVIPPRKKLSRKQVMALKALQGICISIFVASTVLQPLTLAPGLKITGSVAAAAITGYTRSQAAIATFGPQGPGFAIVQLLLIAIVGGITATIAATIGYGNVAKLLIFIGTLICIGLICDVAGGVVDKILDFAGII